MRVSWESNPILFPFLHLRPRATGANIPFFLVFKPPSQLLPGRNREVHMPERTTQTETMSTG